MAYKVDPSLNGVKELKLGRTFNKVYKNEAYHTIRYDFKPASVDSQKTGSLDIVDKEVTLTVPLVSGTGSSQEAVFKGNKTSAFKDCLLIIDNVTGEVVLERISENIRVKKTRTESSSRKVVNRGMVQDSRASKPPIQNNLNNSSNVASNRRSPSKSPARKRSSNPAKTAPPTSATPGSMPLLDFEEEAKNAASDSSSDSESNSGSSSSSSDSDSDSDTESKSTPVPQTLNANGHALNIVNVKSHKSPSILSDLELSEED